MEYWTTRTGSPPSASYQYATDDDDRLIEILANVLNENDEDDEELELWIAPKKRRRENRKNVPMNFRREINRILEI